MAFTLTPKYLRGVSFDPSRRIKKYKAVVRINGKLKHIGYFKTEQEAHQAYLDAKVKVETEAAQGDQSNGRVVE